MLGAKLGLASHLNKVAIQGGSGKTLHEIAKRALGSNALNEFFKGVFLLSHHV